MEEILVPRTVTDVKYQAKDGTLFETQEKCIKHENELDFNAFCLDEKKVFGPITEENWKHYIVLLLKTFYKNPLKHADYIQEARYEKHEWENGEYIKKGFDLDFVKREFTGLFSEISNYEEKLKSRANEKKRTNTYFNEEIFLSQQELINDIHIEKVYEFLFSRKILSIDDLLENSDYLRPSRLSQSELTIEEKKQRIYLNIFYECVKSDSTKALDYAIKHLGLDLAFCLGFFDNRGGWSSSTNDLHMDFFTLLCCSKYRDSFGSYQEFFGLDDRKRLKWIKYIIDKDPALKLYKFKQGYTSYNKNGGSVSGDSKKDEDTFINFSIKDLIDDVKSVADNEWIFLFKKTSKQIIDILTNEIGSNLSKLNNNKMPPYYDLSRKTHNKIKEIFLDFPEMKMVYNKSGLFSVKRILHANSNIDYCDDFHEISIIFCIDVLHNDLDGKTNLVIVEHKTKEGYRKHKYDTRAIINLKDFLSKPDKLASELAFHLNNELPFGPDQVAKIKDIESKILNIEKKKEIMDKQKAILDKEKEDLKKLIPKKK